MGSAYFVGMGSYYGLRILYAIMSTPEQFAPVLMSPLTRIGAAAVTIGGMATLAVFFLVLLLIPIRESRWRTGFSIDETCLRHFPIIDLPFARHTPCIRHDDILRVEARSDPVRSLYAVESPFDEIGGSCTGASAAREWFCAIMARAAELRSPVYESPSDPAAGPPCAGGASAAS